MSWKCARLQEALALEGQALLDSDITARDHLDACRDCRLILESLETLDAAFAGMPALAPPLEAETRMLAEVVRQSGPLDTAEEEALVGATRHLPGGKARGLRVSEESWNERLARQAMEVFTWAKVAAVGVTAFLLTFAFLLFSPNRDLTSVSEGTDGRDADRELLVAGRAPTLEGRLPGAGANPGAVHRSSEGGAGTTADAGRNSRDGFDVRFSSERASRGVEEAFTLQPGDRDDETEMRAVFPAAGPAIAEAFNEAPGEHVPSGEARVASIYDIDPRDPRLSDVTRRFVQALRGVVVARDGHPSAYWQNTYLQGHPEYRVLARTVTSEAFRSEKKAYWPSLRLDADARQPDYGFVDPQQRALSVTVASDRAYASGPSRTLVQVGLQAIRRPSEHEGSHHLGVVLDALDGPGDFAASGYRALLTAIGRSLGDRDRLTVVIADRSDALQVREVDGPPNEIGKIVEWVDRTLRASRSRPSASDEVVSARLPNAMARAARGADQDPEKAPSSVQSILLVTAGALGPAVVERLADRAGDLADRGVSTSVIGVGDRVISAELRRLAVAGQGRSQRLRGVSQAGVLIRRELAAISEMVARAVRLDIRLAPGVDLVGIAGSRPLRAGEAEHVRALFAGVGPDLVASREVKEPSPDADSAAEVAAAHRWIGMYIPAFYAGDSHSLLLDVVVPGAGPVVEVVVQYDDLLFAEPGRERDSLMLPGTAPDVPSSGGVNVAKALLAWLVSERLSEAADDVASGEMARARSRLEGARVIVADISGLVLGLPGDADITADLELLDDYLEALRATSAIAYRARLTIADSLRFASLLKVLPYPRWD